MEKKTLVLLGIGVLIFILVFVVGLNAHGPDASHVIVGLKGSVENENLANSVWYFSTLANVNATSCKFEYCTITNSRLIHCLLWNCTMVNTEKQNCTVLGENP